MGQIVEHEPEVAGIRTRVLELDGEGPRLVLVHGFADSADSWRPVLDELRRRGRGAVAVDLPGFGRAERLKRERAILPQLDAFMDGLAERFGGEGIVVAGNSLGGCVALRCGQRHVEGVRMVVPIAPAGIQHAPWLRLIEASPIARAILGPAPVPDFLVRGGVGLMYRAFGFSTARCADTRTIRSFAQHIPSRRDARRILHTGQRLYPELLSALTELGRISVPVLVIWGDRDRMVPSSGADRILAEAPEAHLELLEGIGHCVQTEAPAATVNLVERYMERFAIAPVAPGGAGA